jgi:putative ABC transport system permease protein
MFLGLFKESVISAATALTTNKLRTFLSLFGITIGIFAIIVVFTIVDSLENNLRKSVKSLGDDVIFVQKWPWSFGPDYPWWKYIKRPEPSYSELDGIKKRSDGALAAAFVVNARVTLKRQSSSIENVTLTAASHDYNSVKNFEIDQGRYFTEQESSAGRPVIIIGDLIASTLFPLQNPVGEYMKLNGAKVMVVGVFKKEGESILGNSLDKEVLVPVNYARNLFELKGDNINKLIMVRAKPGISNDALIDDLTGVMRSLHKLQPREEVDFALNQTSLISNQFDKMFEVVGIIGWVIGGFSILVGGFGIANIMFVSVKERTHIIGIQKSLGAKNHFILSQFLFEAVFLSLIGGAIGLLMVFIITLLAGNAFGMEIKLTSSNIILGLTISTLIGIVSGFVPAYGASQLDPVEAIRSN